MINVSFSVGIWTFKMYSFPSLSILASVLSTSTFPFQLGSIYEVLFERDGGIPFKNLANQLETYSKLRKAPIFLWWTEFHPVLSPLFPFSCGPGWINPKTENPGFYHDPTGGVNLPWPFMSASTAATSLFFIIGKILPESDGEIGLANFTKDFFL